MTKRRHKGKKLKLNAREQGRFDFDPVMPTSDLLEHMDLDDPGNLDEALDNLIYSPGLSGRLFVSCGVR
jgi:hypothetical protein